MINKKIIIIPVLASLIGSCRAADIAELARVEHQSHYLNGYENSYAEDERNEYPPDPFLGYQLITAIAIKNYDLNSINQLLEDGANPNYQHPMYSPLSRRRFLAAPGSLVGMTPLGVLSREEEFTEEMRNVADLLITYDADINQQCAALYPPLGFSIKQRNFAFAHYALDHQANPHLINGLDAIIKDLRKTSWRHPQATYDLINHLEYAAQCLQRAKEPIITHGVSEKMRNPSHVIDIMEETEIDLSKSRRHPISINQELQTLQISILEGSEESSHNSESLSYSRQSVDDWVNVPETKSSEEKEIHPDYAIQNVHGCHSMHLIHTFDALSRAMINYFAHSD